MRKIDIADYDGSDPLYVKYEGMDHVFDVEKEVVEDYEDGEIRDLMYLAFQPLDKENIADKLSQLPPDYRISGVEMTYPSLERELSSKKETGPFREVGPKDLTGMAINFSELVQSLDDYRAEDTSRAVYVLTEDTALIYTTPSTFERFGHVMSQKAGGPEFYVVGHGESRTDLTGLEADLTDPEPELSDLVGKTVKAEIKDDEGIRELEFKINDVLDP